MLRVTYYIKVCESLGLNPMTKPFDYTDAQRGKMVLYARRMPPTSSARFTR